MSQRFEPLLTSATLLDVIPIAEQRTVGDVTIFVTTFERYESGFRINLRLDWIGPTGPRPRLRWRASDDHNTELHHWDCSGSGGGPPFEPGFDPKEDRPHSWRMSCRFAPGVDPAANEVIIKLSALRWIEPVDVSGLAPFVVSLRR